MLCQYTTLKKRANYFKERQGVRSMSGKEFAQELCKCCKGKCEYFENCLHETVGREEVPQSEIDTDYNCRFNATEKR